MRVSFMRVGRYPPTDRQTDRPTDRHRHFKSSDGAKNSKNSHFSCLKMNVKFGLRYGTRFKLNSDIFVKVN